MNADQHKSDSWPDTLAAIHAARFSCRAFLAKQVPQETIERILEIAQRTATWCNTQPWQLHITTGAGTERLRSALLEHVRGGGAKGSDVTWPREYRGRYLERRRDAGLKLYGALGIARDDAEGKTRQMLENFRFFGAPHMVLVTTDEALGPYGVLDCGAWVSSFLLAATACNVATIAQAAIAQYSAFMRNYFEIPADRQIVCAISFGYQDTGHPVNSFRVARAPASSAITWQTT
jgi:nitroreductase